MTNHYINIIVTFLGMLYFINIKAQTPLFPNSVVSNDIDFIVETDPDAFENLSFVGRMDKEMPSSISNELFDTNTFIFEATFSDDETLEIWCHSAFETETAAREYAEKISPRLGKLPAFQRNLLNHVVVHKGDATAFAEIEGRFFMLYSDNIDDRISTNDLEETIFHESVHASYQSLYENDPIWLNAQMSDPTFITEYAQNNVSLEDMAESALFAYTYITQPGRLSPDIEQWLETNIPNRIEFFRTLYGLPSSVETVENNRVLLYPNPTTGICQIELENVYSNIVAEVYNLSGTLLFTEYINGTFHQLDLNHLKQGLYFVKFSNGVILKVLKQ